MAKQKELAGFERPKVQALEDLAEVYEKSRNKRQKATEHEVADKKALIDGMAAAKLTTYKTDSGRIVTVTAGKVGVKVAESDEVEVDEEEDDDAN